MLVQKSKFLKYLPETFNLLDKEVATVKPKQPNTSSKAIITLEILTCIKMLLRNFGEEFSQKFDMVMFTNDLFFFGFNK